SFTNDVLNSLSVARVAVADHDESSFTWTVMSHDPLVGAEDKVWYVDVSIPLDPVETSKSERIGFRLEQLEELGKTPASMDPAALRAASAERNRLLAELAEARKEEARAKEAALARPTVEPDPKKRAAQNRELVERANRLEAQRKALEAKKPAEPPQQAAD